MPGQNEDLTSGQGRKDRRQAGQVLPIFVVMSVVLLGGAALLTDVAWWWTTEQQMQRAADAAALAGAVYLPGNQSRAYAAAQAEAIKNGYTNGVDGVTITPRRDLGNPRKLIVDIDGGVNTNFARVFCWQGGPCLSRVPIGVTGAAEFVFPVPMGSPQNYYGVGQLVDVVSQPPVPHAGDVIRTSPTAFLSNGPNNQWSNAGNAFGSGSTSENANNHVQAWRGFDLSGLPSSATIAGIRVLLTDADLEGSGNSTCRLSVDLSWDGGSTWSTAVPSAVLSTNGTGQLAIPPTSSISDWGAHPWTRADFIDPPGSTPAPFQVRLRWNNGPNASSSCSSNRTVRVNEIDIEITYDWLEAVPDVVEEVDVTGPDEDSSIVLEPQNFWGTVQSQGTAAISGDAYMARYDVAKSAVNSVHSPDGYYHYAVEMPAGTSDGEIWIFDPGFCEVDYPNGTGEHSLGATGLGTTPLRAMSTFYDVYLDDDHTPYVHSDDTLIAPSGNAYRNMLHYDSGLWGSTNNGTDCRDFAWHNEWVQIASGLGAGDYRVHVHTDDPGTSQDDTAAYNNFAIYADTDNGLPLPRVYGLGAMEGYVRVPSDSETAFYLAQIGAEHAGKTMVINLWDAGDTNRLAANLEILRPTNGAYNNGAGYVPVQFSYRSRKVSTHSSANSCDLNNGTYVGNDVWSVVTNNGSNTNDGKVFNGCWLSIEIPIPLDYDAPLPTGEPFATDGGWWKVRYNIGGSGTAVATDLTTWQVELRGNPVHLVPE